MTNCGGDVDWDAWVAGVHARLRPAFVAALGYEGAQVALSVALEYAWVNRKRVVGLANPVGYLYRVGVRHARRPPRRVRYPMSTPQALPEVEPGLGPALGRLSRQQRIAVVLVHGYGWTAREVAELCGVSVSSVETHLQRGLRSLRSQMGVER